MLNCISPDSIESWYSSSNIIASIAVLISFFTLVASIFIIYTTKRLEIKYLEFEKLCINNIDSILCGLDKLFNKHEHDVIKEHRVKITNTIVELQIFLIRLKEKKYSKIDINKIVVDLEKFTEKVYTDKNLKILRLKGDYYSTKIELYDDLYEYALQKELKFSFIQRRKKKKVIQISS
jgi:hypothetical protein